MGAADLIQGWGQMGESPPTIFPCYKRALAIPALGNLPLGVTAALFTVFLFRPSLEWLLTSYYFLFVFFFSVTVFCVLGFSHDLTSLEHVETLS